MGAESVIVPVEKSTSTAVPSTVDTPAPALAETPPAERSFLQRKSLKYMLTGEIPPENEPSSPAARLRAAAKSVSLEDVFDVSKQRQVIASRDKFLAAIEERAYREKIAKIAPSRLRANEPFIVDPRKSTPYKAWVVVVLLAMLYTAAVTPVECAFHNPPPRCTIDMLFVINRIIDVIFYIDMIITFRLAYFDPRSGRWVREGKAIAQRYLRGFFIIDLISVIPLWPIAFSGCGGALANEGILPSDEALGSSGASSAARNVRLLRLLRLTRLVKASRVLLSLLEDLMTNHFEATYANLKLTKLALALCAFSHWQACLFGMAKFFSPVGEEAMWYQVLAQRAEDLSESPSPWDVYVLAFYASVGILTGIVSHAAATASGTCPDACTCTHASTNNNALIRIPAVAGR